VGVGLPIVKRCLLSGTFPVRNLTSSELCLRASLLLTFVKDGDDIEGSSLCAYLALGDR
jgi:hypothetical protein